MELILKSDVPNLGFKDDVVIVKNGYGRNYLIPQGFAILATPSAKKVLAENIKQREFKEKKEIDEANKIAKKLAKLEIKISAKSGTGGKLFGSISNSDLSAELSNLGFDFDKKIIKIQGGTVKRLGIYSASLRLHRNVIQELSFEVIKAED
jgi:large subunit ribosomal protein L9